MHPRAIFVLCLYVVAPFLCHGKMADTRDILESLSIDPNSVLDHEVVEIDLPSRIHKRDLVSGVPAKIRALGMDLNLLLLPTDSLFATDETKVYKAYHTPKGSTTVTYKEVVGAMKEVGKILKDPKHLATVILKPGASGKPTISGHLVHKKTPVVIKPLHPRVANKYMKSRRSINDLDDDSDNKTYHLVAKLKEEFAGKRFTRDLSKSSPQRNTKLPLKPLPGSTNKNTLGNPNVVRPQAPRQQVTSRPATRPQAPRQQVTTRPAKRPLTPSQQGPQAPPQKVSRPQVLRPEILVEIDHTLKDILERHGMPFLLEYILAFWNGVDMIFRDVDQPKIRLNIAVIIIAMDPEATPFIATSMTEPGAFDHHIALNESARYRFKIKDIFSLESYDLASTMTNLEMGRNGAKNALGVAYLDGVCHNPSESERTSSVSLIHDNGGFSGILTAAHEVGHLFGLHHDDEDVAPGCTPTSGHVMTHQSTTAKDSSWFSKCSLQTFRKNYEEGKYECTYNLPPSAGKELPKFMPGVMEALTKQCEALGHNKTCIREDEFNDICVQFWCEVSSNEYDCTKEEVRTAPDSPCGNRDDAILTRTSCMPYSQGAAPGSLCGIEGDTIPKYCLKSRCVAV